MRKQQNEAVRSTFKTSPAKKKPQARRKKAEKAMPITVVKANPHALRAARVLADGDDRRLSVQPDGMVIVNNRPRNGGPKV